MPHPRPCVLQRVRPTRTPLRREHKLVALGFARTDYTLAKPNLVAELVFRDLISLDHPSCFGETSIRALVASLESG